MTVTITMKKMLSVGTKAIKKGGPSDHTTQLVHARLKKLKVRRDPYALDCVPDNLKT